MMKTLLLRYPNPVRGLVFALSMLGGVVVLAWGASAPTPPARIIADLIAPFAPGDIVADGFVLSRPHRGDAHDIVFEARRTSLGVSTVVELHVLDRGRWPGVRESANYGIAWEVPRTSATRAHAEAVTERLAQAVRRNDVGIAPPVDEIALAPNTPHPPMALALERMSGARGALLGFLLVLATWALATLPYGAALVGAFLFALGLALRLPYLDVPFVRDQDVQRLITGSASIREILTGVGLRDRHPPLYFLVLHAAQLFGQSECVVRMPAVIAGALVGPSIVASASLMKRRVEVGAIFALVPVLGGAFVAHSREVSSIPLYALMLVALATSVVLHHETGARRWKVAIVSSVALALFTYYTAVFPIAALAVVLGCLGRAYAGSLRAVLLGAVLGSPALLLATATFLRDRGARVVARARPSVAWGDRDVFETARSMGHVALDALGPPVLVCVLVACLAGAKRRDLGVLVPLVIAAATFVGVAGLAPYARVQPYYILGALPVFVLCAAVSPLPARPRARIAAASIVAVTIALSTVPFVSQVSTLYVADARAVMPDFVRTMIRGDVRRVATVAHYDTTLLTYYLARAHGVRISDRTLVAERDGSSVRGTDFVLHPIVRTHAAGMDLESDARAALDRLIAEGPCLVVDRPSLDIRSIRARLATCERLAEGPDTALYRCAPGP